MKKIVPFIAVLMVASLYGSGSVLAAGEKVSTGMWVAVYHPCYQWFDVPAANVPWNDITHLIIGYMIPEKAGTTWSVGIPDGWSLGETSFFDMAKSYVSSGHAAERKVTFMIGGAGSDDDSVWNKAASADSVDSFAVNIKNLLTSIGCDGVDLDWEENIDFPSLVRLAENLREVWPNAVITIPVNPFVGDESYLAPAKDAVDAFMPMSYSSISQWGGWLIPVPLTPLYGAIRPSLGENPYSVDYKLRALEAAGVPASKIIMGVGGYGDIWGDTNGDGNGPIAPYSCPDINSAVYGETSSIANDNVVTQSWLQNFLAANPGKFIEDWDSVGRCSYWHTSAPDQNAIFNLWGTDYKVTLIFYESPRSITEKVSYIDQKGMKGMMFWTLSEMMDSADSTSFPNLKAITPTSVRSSQTSKIAGFKLDQSYPNPFNPSTTISYELSANSFVILKVYDVLGREVATLVDERQSVGSHSVVFSAEGGSASGGHAGSLASGVYFCRITAVGNDGQKFTGMKKLVLVK